MVETVLQSFFLVEFCCYFVYSEERRKICVWIKVDQKCQKFHRHKINIHSLSFSLKLMAGVGAILNLYKFLKKDFIKPLFILFLTQLYFYLLQSYANNPLKFDIDIGNYLLPQN